MKAIDLWCKPDPPEDNFEEDASGWGSGDEVSCVFLFISITIKSELSSSLSSLDSQHHHNQEGAVEGALERPSSRPSGGPHPEWLCEMCKVDYLSLSD